MIALGFLYLAMAFAVTRRVYQRVRPSGVPLCKVEAGGLHTIKTEYGSRDAYPSTKGTYDGHYYSCYTRWQEIKHTSEAVWTGIAAGVFWPVFLTGLGGFLLITGKPRETTREKEVRLAKLEKALKAKEKELGFK